RYRLNQFIMSLLQVIHGSAPRGFALVENGRKIFFVAQVYRLPSSASPDGIIPCRNMQDQFPDAVSILQRMSRRHLSVDSGQNLLDRIAMPGFSVIRAPDLVC